MYKSLRWSNVEQAKELLGHGCYVLNIPKIQSILNIMHQTSVA